jgi:hypothetical protein
MQDDYRFFGREPEVLELASLVRANYTVLLHSESGAGKSSMVEAGLMHELQARGCEVLPTARLQQVHRPDAPRKPAPNPYVDNLLKCWLDAELEPATVGAATLADFLGTQPTDEASEARIRVVVIDQFEELFTLYPGHWRTREDFFRQVQQALDDNRLLRFLFVMRGDYLARLGPYKDLLTDGLRAQFPLDRLRQENALEAVVGPARMAGRSFAEGVAEALVEDLLTIPREPDAPRLLGEHVEAVELQIVCRELWERLPPDVTVIEREHLTKVGRIDEVLARFYDRAIDETAVAAKVRRRTLRTWFDRKLITPAKTRGIVFKGEQTTEGLPNAAVELLERHRLIRSEPRGNSVWYELTHDRLVDAVVDSNRKWLEQREATRSRQLRAALAVIVTAVLLLGANIFLQRKQPESLKHLDQLGEITATDRPDTYPVSGRAGETAVVRVQPEDDQFGIRLRLLDPKGSLVAEDRSDGYPGAHVFATLPADAVYTVEVSSEEVGRYHVRGAIVDEQVPGFGEVRGLRIRDSDEVDVVDFGRTTPGAVMIEMRSEKDLDGHFEVVGPGEQLLTSVDNTADSPDPFVALYLQDPGHYRVLVSASGSGTGAYELTITSGSKPLADGTPATGVVGSDARLHAYTFENLKEELAIVEMRSEENTGLDCHLRLFGPRGDLLAEAGSARTLDAIVAAIVTRGNHYVVVASGYRKSGKGSFGRYRLLLSARPPR